ncbi:MAG: hypothetical protein AAF360_09330 [Pseudomonadota bacterium]
MNTRALSAAIAAAVLSAGAASACDMIRLVDISLQNGGYQLYVNGVFVDEGSGGSIYSGKPLRNWLVEGENTVTLDYEAESGTASLREGCEATFDKAITTAEIALSGASTAEMTFKVKEPVAAEYVKADVADEAGLMDAVAALRTAIANKDFDAFWALHAPMLREYERQGAPMELLEERYGELLKVMDPVYAEGLSAEPVLGGLVHIVRGADGAPTVSYEGKVDGSSIRWTTGTYWARFDGEWGVMER